MLYRNIHGQSPSGYFKVIHDIRRLSPKIRDMIYGSDASWHYGADNVIRLYSVFKTPVVTPLLRKRSEHKTAPRKSDKVVVIDGDEELFGHVIYVDRDGDTVGCYMYAARKMESFSLDCLESNSGRIRWRIIC